MGILLSSGLIRGLVFFGCRDGLSNDHVTQFGPVRVRPSILTQMVKKKFSEILPVVMMSRATVKL